MTKDELLQKARDVFGGTWAKHLMVFSKNELLEPLLAADMLHDPAEVRKMRELVFRLSAGASEAYKNNNLLGRRVGLAEDFHDPAEVARGREALEAWVEYAKASDRGEIFAGPEGRRGIVMARAELERRKPKPRWTVERNGVYWVARNNVDGGSVCFYLDAEPEARAYVARKNAEASSDPLDYAR